MSRRDFPKGYNGWERLGIVGDWHGNTRWAGHILESLRNDDIKNIYSLGDYGVWPGTSGKHYLDTQQEMLRARDQVLWVTLGNHEDYTQINNIEEDHDGCKWIRPNICIFPRGYRFTIDGVSFMSLGGAPSIDYEFRSMYKSWWPEEMITEEEAAYAISGGSVDVMLAHDAPDRGTQRVQSIIMSNPMGWSRKALAYAAIGRERMTQVVQAVQPKVFFHGHYHVQDSGYLNYGEDKEPGVIHAVNCDGVPGNVGIFTPADLQFEWKEYA